jgi:ribosome-binding factor A
MAGEVKRSIRVAERIREEISTLLLRDINDPRVQGAIIARVELPDDLRTATIYFRLLHGGEKPERRTEVEAGFARASGLIRREITRRLSLRHAPELKFTYDSGQEKLDRIDQLLHEVREDSRKG